PPFPYTTLFRSLRRGLHPAQLRHLRAVRSQRLFADAASGTVLSPPAVQAGESRARNRQHLPLRGPVVGPVSRRSRHRASLVFPLSTSPPPEVVGGVSLAEVGVAQGALSLQRARHARAAHERSAPEVLPRASADVARFPGPPAFRFS